MSARWPFGKNLLRKRRPLMVAGFHWTREFGQFLVLRFACMAPQKLRLKGTVHTNMTFLFQTCMAFFCWTLKIFWRMVPIDFHCLDKIQWKSKGTETVWLPSRITKHQICIRFRTTYESGLGLIWNKTDLCCSDCHKKIRYGSHLGKKVGFGPL